MMSQPRRKKWTEAEERSLIDVYDDMRCDGTLLKMKTREKKYKPIAQYVNSMHHARDPVSYPWQWTWKDVSTKVQNMRHQYALVKQKIKTQDSDFDWLEGDSHWPNFLRYKEVFGDVPLAFNGSIDSANVVVGVANECGFEGGGGGHEMEIAEFAQLGQVGEGDFVNGIENGVMDLEFDYDAEEGQENCNGGDVNDKNHGKSEICVGEDDMGASTRFVGEENRPSSSNTRKKRKVFLRRSEKKAWGFLLNQLGQLKEMENQFERREVERVRERERIAQSRIEKEKEREAKWDEMEKDRQAKEIERSKLRRQWIREWEVVEREHEERENRRNEEELRREREWEEKLNLRRLEWKKRMDETLNRHRAEMAQIQARILHDQQSITNHFIGVVSQWTTGHPSGLSDHTGASGHYLSQMMQNLHHVNGIHGDDERVEGDNQEDQFIVDG